MKKIAVIFLLISHASFGQINLPDLSGEERLHEVIGYTTFDIYYGRPAARGRKIMGGLVPYKKLWRTGAGKGTTVLFDRDVVIDNKIVHAGSYSLTTIPDEKEWIVLLNTDTSKIYGDPREYDVKTEALRFKVTPEKTSRHYESLTITLDIAQWDATLYLAWENSQIHFQIKTGSYKQALAEISTGLAQSPEDQDLLLQGAWYYYMNNENPAQALQWVDKALSISENRWAYEQKIDLLDRMKKYEEARKTVDRAVNFLNRTKPDEWEATVKEYEVKMKHWPTR
jgi:tetratricopeptide (TPR) repeat protein